MSNVESEYSSMVRLCADKGCQLMQSLSSIGTIEPLYLFARESVLDVPGELLLVRDGEPNPVGYKLVTGEGLRIDVPYDRYYQWVYERARNARILSIGKAA